MHQESTSTPAGPNSVSYRFFQTSEGISLRYGWWPARRTPLRGTFVVLSGRAEFLEKYEETALEITARGFNAVSFDWRGQGRSDRLLTDPNRGFVQSFDQYLTDLSEVMETLILPRVTGPLFFLSHSMGAHLTLRYLAQYQPERIAKAIAIAPMQAIYTDPLPVAVAKGLSALMVRLRLGHWKAPGLRHNPILNPWVSNRLTSDHQRFQRAKAQIALDPYKDVGWVTYGWLAAAFRSMDDLNTRRARQLPPIPLLMVMAGKDRIVHNQAVSRLTNRLPHCQSVLIPGAKHEILQEGDGVRSQFWQAFDGFMADV